MAGRPACRLVIDSEMVDPCSFDPGFEVDLLISCELRAMTAVWMGISNFEAEVRRGAPLVDGDPQTARSISDWMAKSQAGPKPVRLA